MASQQQDKLDKLVTEAIDIAEVITEAVDIAEAIKEAVDIAEEGVEIFLAIEEIDKIATSKHPYFRIKNTSTAGRTSTASHLFIDTLSLQLLYDSRIDASKNLSLVIKVERMKMKSDDTKWYTISNIVIPKAYLAFLQEFKSPYNLEFQLEDELPPQLFQLEQDPKFATKFAICTHLPAHKKAIYLVPTTVPVYNKKGKVVGETKTIIGEEDHKKLDKYVFQFSQVKKNELLVDDD